MTEYQSNSKKTQAAAVPAEKKVVEKVVVSEVIIQRKSLGQKFKSIFAEADLRSVVRYVGMDVLIPAMRNTIVDAATRGVERLMYGESAIQRRNYGMTGSRIQYNNPVNRGYRPDPRNAPPVQQGPRRTNRSQSNIILSSREEAELVIERLNDLIDKYDVASVADLNDLLGEPTSYTDNKWGWVFLGDVVPRQIREGYLLDLPDPEPLMG